MIAAGDEKGELFVWQDEMFNRRLTSEESNDNDERRQSMRERLKALRNARIYLILQSNDLQAPVTSMLIFPIFL